MRKLRCCLLSRGNDTSGSHSAYTFTQKCRYLPVCSPWLGGQGGRLAVACESWRCPSCSGVGARHGPLQLGPSRTNWPDLTYIALSPTAQCAETFLVLFTEDAAMQCSSIRIWKDPCFFLGGGGSMQRLNNFRAIPRRLRLGYDMHVIVRHVRFYKFGT